jgi:heme A synthase
MKTQSLVGAASQAVSRPRLRFHEYAWGLLAYSVAVVLLGAFVRASKSGDGCGSHWPLCNGRVLPRTEHAATLIEFTHRLTSGVALLLVVALLAWALARHGASSTASAGAREPRGRLRQALAARPWPAELRSAALAMAFMISEALVGAGLVLFGLVGDDASPARAVVLGIHLVNTFFLLAFVALTAWFASGGRPVRLRGPDVLRPLLGAALVGLLVLGVTGAMTALGDTLFPAASLREGVRRDFSSAAHFLERLRVLHPALAVALGAYLLVVAGAVLRHRSDEWSRRLARGVIALFFVQLGVGTVNLLLLAPVAMQLVHLLLADLVWLSVVLLAAAALAAPAEAAAAPDLPARGAAAAGAAFGGRRERPAALR